MIQASTLCSLFLCAPPRLRACACAVRPPPPSPVAMPSLLRVLYWFAAIALSVLGLMIANWELREQRVSKNCPGTVYHGYAWFRFILAIAQVSSGIAALCTVGSH
jgi:hypothetical protein